ncbi:MAG: LTA synthase family protein, partial [Muribaculaceae bacterium]|nr:LTA synthase family protein [Muribaculaceae bacterium]
KGYTTFTDSLINQSLTWRNAFANGSLSIDAIPSVMLSVPEMENAFALCPYATNDVAGIATHLGSIGYESAFFHGAENSSMGFQAIAKAAGFAKYYGRENYEQEDFMGGKKDFDGTWAIWDEEFLQYTCSKISKMKEPFVSGIFTASSHHPFTLPEKYKNVYPEEGKYPLHKCIRYTDNALRLFFASASRQPWYKNTIFVITADHASTKITHKEYNNEVGLFKIPIIFFDPSGEMPRQIVDGVAQQIDIMPTILNYLGYNKPYIAFGNDLLSTPPDKSWAFVWDNGLPQYFQGEYVIQYQGDSIAKAYNFVTDPTLKHNIKGSFPQQPEMDRKAKAIMQSVLSREAGNQMVISD